MLIFIVSIFSGIISGMGIGGGTILIPALTIIFGTCQHTAQSVNLLSFIPIGAVALITHIKNKNIESKLSVKLIASGIAGSIVGSLLASSMSSDQLRKIFAVFLLLMGSYEILAKKK